MGLGAAGLWLVWEETLSTWEGKETPTTDLLPFEYILKFFFSKKQLVT
jgi:hypothetical protein